MKKLIFLLLLISFTACNSTKKQEPLPQEPVPQVSEPVQQSADEEFNRSTANVSISKEEFISDKSEILRIIASLSEIMTDYNFDGWLKYIDNESVQYWSNPKNLKNASKRLPYKNQALNNINDYFRLVFVPSRKGRSVEEIRYISRDSVKAVEVRDEEDGPRDVVYYNFVKVNDKWMVKIPPLQSN